MIALKKHSLDYTNQIFQSISVLFSFCKKHTDNDYEQLHVPIKCRDFLGDVIWSKKTGREVAIYSFHYDEKKKPIDTDKLRLSLTFPDEGSMTTFMDNFEEINKVGVKAEVDHTTYYLTDDKLTLIVEADSYWQSAQWKISLFTFYLKLMCYKNRKELQDPEDKYYPCLTPNNEKKLLENVKKDVDHLWETINQAHNYSGFVSVCKGQNKELHAAIIGG